MRLLLAALIVASFVIQGDCWWARKKRRLSRIGTDGLSYTFRNRTSIRRRGKWELAIVVNLADKPHMRKRSTDDQQNPALPKKPCNKCLEIRAIKYQDKEVKNTTEAKNDFIMVVKLVEENMSVSKLKAQIKFKVMEIIKNPIATITSGQTFTIDADLAKCTCMRLLEPGFYVVTGMVNDNNQLFLSNVLMEFEE